ncbi:MAG TPA: hypothetical protein EYP65_02985, partial [Armatimonadetes bacterium]|nr:hypothetical protein [Armatimonadota bacterium]
MMVLLAFITASATRPLVLTPERVVELALKRSLSVKAAAHKLKGAEAKIAQAKALKMPRLTVSDTRTIL